MMIASKPLTMLCKKSFISDMITGSGAFVCVMHTQHACHANTRGYQECPEEILRIEALRLNLGVFWST